MKKRAIRKTYLPQPVESHPRLHDSLLSQRITLLRQSDILPDLNEPLSRKYLSSSGGDTEFRSMIQLSRDWFFKIHFDNDILDNTDRFYTNGIRFDLIGPSFRYSPLSYLMVPYWHTAINYYGMALTQNMYTPSTTKTGGILYGDRPYAAFLTLSSFKISCDEDHRVRLRSELMIGVIGPSSQGEMVQKVFHNNVPTNNEPLGWEYQIQDDLVLNYFTEIEKGLLQFRKMDLSVKGSGALGTLYDNLTGGMKFRVGRMNPYFHDLGLARRDRYEGSGLKQWQVYAYLDAGLKLVGYDATLQGGMFNGSSAYTIPGSDISRIQFNGTLGIALVFHGFKFEAEQYLISPEFKNGWWHKWVHFGLTFAL